MGRLISETILGFFVGAVAILALAGQSEQVSLGHFRLPIHFEFEFGDATADAGQAVALPAASFTTTTTVSDVPPPREFEQIREPRQVCGSPLEGSVLVEGVPPEQLQSEFNSGLRTVCQEAATPICVATSPAGCPIASSTVTVSSPTIAVTPASALAASEVCDDLDATAARLYALAAAYEEQTYYERADEVRSLARNLRNQSQFIAREVAISPPVETAARPVSTPEPPQANPPALPAASPVVEAPSDPTNPDS
ncbi:MAG: hypothetical protein SFU86_16430 [Pirellulaceae bacterium]|nr:hypothetical protein [Pirellulaceae bacterium]